MAKISIIVPIFKVENYINRCIQSITSQTFDDFELILIDDGSQDKCPMICDELLLSFSNVIVIHQVNGGLSAARNSGIKNASGEWITFIDSDDWVHPCYLQALYDAVLTYNTNIAIGTYLTVNHFSETPIIKCVSSLQNTEEYWLNNRTNATTAWGKLFRKELFDNVSFPVGKYHEDEYVTYRLLFQFDSVAVVDTPIYFYFCNYEGITGLNYMDRYPDIIECFQLHLDYFENTNYQKAYRLEIEKYAECISEAIYCLKRADKRDKRIPILRKTLKAFLSSHKSMIPWNKRKDIYISAYPSHELFIRGLGYIRKNEMVKENDTR